MSSIEQVETMDDSTVSQRIGLVAGAGRYPLVVAEALLEQGHEVYCIGVKDHADPKLSNLCTDYIQCGMGRLGAGIRYFRQNHICRATMAGKIQKVSLFKPHYWLNLFPDWRGFCTFYPHFISRKKNRCDDTLLGAVVEAYAKGGISFVPATFFVPEILVKLGQICGRRLSGSQRQDIEFGWRMAKELGRIDVGQCVVVKGRAVLALEAIEGTDLCVSRAGDLCPSGGFTVIKVAKPQQDMRFDVPTIGTQTIKIMAEAGGAVLAIEADKTILIDKDEVIRLANQHKIAIVAIEDAMQGGFRKAA